MNHDDEWLPSPIDCLLDPDNVDPIMLFSEKGDLVSFEQIAIVPIEGKVYAILRPMEPPEGMEEDEALVFVLDEFEEEDCLTILEDDAMVDRVFEQYYAMLRVQGIALD